MFAFLNRKPAKSARRKPTRNVLAGERLEERVNFSSLISIPATAGVIEGKMPAYTLPITRTGDISKPATLSYSYQLGSADAKDISRGVYTGTFTLQPGVSLFTLNPLSIVDDKADEDDETVIIRLNLVSGSGAKLGNDKTTLTIRDNDDAPTVSILPLTASKNEDGANVNFRVQLSAPSEKEITVNLQGMSNGTMNWGTDASFYGKGTATSMPLVLRPGVGAYEFLVSIANDRIVEADEKIRIGITGGKNIGGVTTSVAETVIKDNDIPTFTLRGGGRYLEGSLARFDISVQEKLERPVSVRYIAADDEAKAGLDYVAASGVLKFTSNTSPQSVIVTIKNDSLLEFSDEDFAFYLDSVDSSPANRIETYRGHATVTILDNTPLSGATPLWITTTAAAPATPNLAAVNDAVFAQWATNGTSDRDVWVDDLLSLQSKKR